MTAPGINLPWIRRYNYYQDYFKTVYEYYVAAYPAYVVTYYSIDFENSVLEDEYLNAGTYDKMGVGTLSGMKWKKISLFPVFGIEQIQPVADSSEDGGINFRDSMETTISFPSLFGITPYAGDIVDLNFGFDSPTVKLKPIYYVGNVPALAHSGEFYNIYQCPLKLAPFDLTQVEKQISSYWIFVEHEKRIFTYDKANTLLNIQERAENLVINMNSLFNSKTSFYLD